MPHALEKDIALPVHPLTVEYLFEVVIFDRFATVSRTMQSESGTQPRNAVHKLTDICMDSSENSITETRTAVACWVLEDCLRLEWWFAHTMRGWETEKS